MVAFLGVRTFASVRATERDERTDGQTDGRTEKETTKNSRGIPLFRSTPSQFSLVAARTELKVENYMYERMLCTYSCMCAVEAGTLSSAGKAEAEPNRIEFEMEIEFRIRPSLGVAARRGAATAEPRFARIRIRVVNARRNVATTIFLFFHHSGIVDFLCGNAGYKIIHEA